MICIIGVPEFSHADVDKSIKSGMVLSVDITNEFIEIDKSIVMETTSPSGTKEQNRPLLLERHVAKFRQRFFETGIYEMAVFDKNEKLLISSFEVV